MVTLTDVAKNRIREILARPRSRGQGLRLFVEGGGAPDSSTLLVRQKKRTIRSSTRCFELAIDPGSAMY